MQPFQIESALEAAAKAALAARQLPAYSRLDTAQLPPARVVVEATAFSQASEQQAKSEDGQWFACHYRGQLQFTVKTPRAGDGPGKHAAWLGALRAAMARPAQSLAGLPAMEVLRVAESSGSVAYINEGEADRSEIVFDVEVALLGSAVNFTPSPP